MKMNNGMNIVVRGTLDLHGYTKTVAIRRVTDFIEQMATRYGTTKTHHQESYSSSSCWVCIITGTGAHSSSGPVLRAAVETLLRKRNMTFFVPPQRSRGSFLVDCCSGVVLINPSLPTDSKVIVLQQQQQQQQHHYAHSHKLLDDGIRLVNRRNVPSKKNQKTIANSHHENGDKDATTQQQSRFQLKDYVWPQEQQYPFVPHDVVMDDTLLERVKHVSRKELLKHKQLLQQDEQVVNRVLHVSQQEMERFDTLQQDYERKLHHAMMESTTSTTMNEEDDDEEEEELRKILIASENERARQEEEEERAFQETLNKIRLMEEEEEEENQNQVVHDGDDDDEERRILEQIILQSMMDGIDDKKTYHDNHHDDDEKALRLALEQSLHGN